MGANRLKILQEWDEKLTALSKSEGRTVTELKTQRIDEFLVTWSNFEKHQKMKQKT